MQDSIFNIKGKFGNSNQDIKCAYVLAKKENIFDAVYIKYNDGGIKKITKPSNISYKEFTKEISILLVSIGANNNNKKKRWYVLPKKNKLGISFDYLENTYQNQIMSDDTISFDIDDNLKKSFKALKIEKIEDLEELEDDYSIYKVKVIRNIISATALSLSSYFLADKFGLNININLISSIDVLLLLSSMVDAIVLLENKKLRKKIELSIQNIR